MSDETDFQFKSLEKINAIDQKIDHLEQLIRINERWRVHSLNHVISRLKIIEAFSIAGFYLLVYLIIKLVNPTSWNYYLFIGSVICFHFFVHYSVEKYHNFWNKAYDQSNKFAN